MNVRLLKWITTRVPPSFPIRGERFCWLEQGEVSRERVAFGILVNPLLIGLGASACARYMLGRINGLARQRSFEIRHVYLPQSGREAGKICRPQNLRKTLLRRSLVLFSNILDQNKSISIAAARLRELFQMLGECSKYLYQPIRVVTVAKGNAPWWCPQCRRPVFANQTPISTLN